MSGSAWIEPKHGIPCRVCWRRNGKRQRPSRWFRKRRDAIALRNALTKKLRAESHIIPAGQLIALTEIRDRWIAARQAEGRMADGTAHEAGREISRVLKLTKWTTVESITPFRLRDFRKEYPQCVRGTAMRYLRAMLRWAALGHTLAQPVPMGLDLSCPQSTPAERPLVSNQQLSDLIAKTRADGNFPLIHVAAIYPWRPKSLSLLRIRDTSLLDRQRGSVVLRRTKNGRDVRGRLLPETVDILRKVTTGRPPDAFVFLRSHGEPWPIDKKGSGHAMSAWFAKTLGAHGIRLYDLKRRGMTELLRAAKGDIAAVAAIAGISKAMVLRYIQTNDERSREVLQDFRGNSGAVLGLFEEAMPSTTADSLIGDPDITITYNPK